MFYNTFTELCRKQDIAPSALARQLGMSASAPGRWRDGSSPDLETIKKIADHFGVSIDYLVRGEDNSHQRIVATERSIIMQGNAGNNVVSSGGSASVGNGLTEQEQEILRIFRGLDMRKKTAFLSYGYELEDGK